MKYKKYLVFIMILMLFGINKIYAETCQYANNDDNVLIKYNTSIQKFTIEKRNNKTNNIFSANLGSEPLINNNKDFKDGKTGIKVMAIDGKRCPEYIVYRRNTNFIGSDGIYGFNNASSANAFSSASNQINTKIKAWTLNTINVSSQQFEEMRKTNSGYNGGDISCDGIFGSKNDSNSLRYLINEILMYPKIIVPALVIGLGSLDFAKAVVASKEDEMKKAQKTFIKRVIIGITIFFVPLIMNIIMYLADIVWNGAFTTCGI